MEKKSASALKCPECGGEFAASDLLDSDEFVTCLGCGKKFRTADIFQKTTDEKVEEIRARAYVEVEKDRTQAYREVEEGKRKVEFEQIQQEKNKDEKQQIESERSRFKKSKWRIVIIVFIVFSAMICAVAFNDGKVIAGIIGALMTIIFIVCLLMGLGVIPEKPKGLMLVLFIIGSILFLHCTFAYTSTNTSAMDSVQYIKQIENYY